MLITSLRKIGLNFGMLVLAKKPRFKALIKIKVYIKDVKRFLKVRVKFDQII